jgi:hypothetical protein
MITTQNISMLLGVIFLAMAAAGCQIVRVVDQNGDPVPWAKVQVASSPHDRSEGLSMPVYTDLLGNAMISQSMDDTVSEWIVVSKEGYVAKPVSRGVDDKIQIQVVEQKTIDQFRDRDTTVNENTNVQPQLSQ